MLGRRALGVAFIFGLLALALFPRSGSGSHVDPIELDYSATCDDLSPPGTEWHELRISSVEDGTYSLEALTVSLNVTIGGDTVSIDWSSNIAVDGIFVKGGPGGNFYHYTPPLTSDTELSTPANPNNGGPFDPGHILICTAASIDLPTATAPPPVTPTPTSTATATSTSTATATSTTTTATATTSPTATTPSETGTPTPSVTATASPTSTPTPTATTDPRNINYLYFPVACIQCNFSPGEQNDSCASAYPLQPDTGYVFFAEDDDDWYRFELQNAAEVTIRLTNFLPQEGQLAAYSGLSCESAVFLRNNGDTASEKILSLGQQPPGTFFLYISNDSEANSVDPYHLVIETR